MNDVPAENERGVIGWFIDWSLKNRFLVICATLVAIAFGIRAIRTTPVDAIPDLSENQVLVYAEWNGRSPQEVEDQLTYPLSTNLQGLAGVRQVRAVSMFGFSLVTVIFKDSVDNGFARTRVLERLSFLKDQMPPGVTPQLGPDATGLGWVYQYYLHVDPSARQDAGSLRALQDFFVRYHLASVEGVAEVASIGGFVRQYKVAISPEKMRHYDVPVRAVLDAMASGNLNVGGKVIEENGMEFVVRGVGLVHSVDDLRQIAVRSAGGMPVYLGDLAEISLGGEFRRGALDVDGRDAVGGIVVMRTGENAMEVIRRVKEKIADISPSLPAGVSIRPFYDRSSLIERTIETLRHALWEEILLVTVAHIIFLWHFRSILIVTIPLPVSILIAFLLMNAAGVSSNIMSLSGIAIAIGVLVDAGIVMTENVIRHCEHAEATLGRRLTAAETMATTGQAARQVGRPIFLAMTIIILAFLPVFALGGQEGKLFHPLAFTKTFAMVGATILAVTLVPVLCSWLVRGPFHPEGSNVVMSALGRIYRPALMWALANGPAILCGAAVLLLAALTVAFGIPRPLASAATRLVPALAGKLPGGLGSEFMPPLDEGSLLFMPVLVPGTSLGAVREVMSWQDRVIRETPEVETAAGKLGRAESATDPAPVEMIETTITLRPRDQWRPGMTRERLVSELSERLSVVPGYVPGFLQPIENRVLMLSTGIRAQVGIKVLGSDPAVLQTVAFEIEKVVRSVPGAVGVTASRALSRPYLEIHPDRQALARFGLDLREVMDVVEAGIGGVTTGVTIEGRQRIPIQLRFEGDARDDIDRLGSILIPTNSGTSVPLGQVARIVRTSGPGEIASEDGMLRVFVQSNVKGRDLGGFVAELRQRVDSEVKLPRGVTLRWSGQYENQLSARKTLSFILPLVLLIIFVVLVVVFRSLAEAAHVLLAVPFALTGGVFLQAALGFPFSVAVWIGYIALFGTAIQTGIVMVVYLEEAVAKRRATTGGLLTKTDLLQAVIDGAMLRLRPKVMTVATIVASLLPIMWSTRAGAEVMKPIATPVVGGMVSSLLHVLIVTPVIFYWLHSRKLPDGQLTTSARPS